MAFCTRRLWSIVLLLSVGCQSTPTGSKALLDFARGDDGRTVSEHEQTDPPITGASLRSDDNGAKWSDDPVLAEVVERELADASPERRRQWLERLDSIAPDEIPILLAERRELIQAGEVDADEKSRRRLVPTTPPRL